jgi:hypothetical protein
MMHSDGVGPRQVSGVGWNSAELTPWIGAITAFLKVKALLGFRAKGRDIIESREGHQVREGPATYDAFLEAKKGDIGFQNAYFWNTNGE